MCPRCIEQDGSHPPFYVLSEAVQDYSRLNQSLINLNYTLVPKSSQRELHLSDMMVFYLVQMPLPLNSSKQI